MKSQYIKSGSTHFALNFKAATSSIVRAIVSAHYPEIEDNLTNNTSYPSGRTVDNSRWHWQLPKTETPDSEVTLIVRDPVERFRSACAETRKTPDEALSEQGQDNSHFWPTSRLLTTGVKLYRFDTDLDDAAVALGLALPLVDIAGDNPPKPDLTPDQLARVQAIYADDIALYESITEAGQEYVMPPVPPAPPEPVPVPRKVSPAQFRMALNELSLRDSVEAAVAGSSQDVQDHWEYATFISRTDPSVVAIAGAIGLSETETDDVFILANTK